MQSSKVARREIRKPFSVMKKRKAIRTGKSRDLFKKIRGNPEYISCKRQARKRTEIVWTSQKQKIVRRGGKQRVSGDFSLFLPPNLS